MNNKRVLTNNGFYVFKTTSKCVQQHPFWETNSRSAVQKIFRLLWNPTIHYPVHKSRPLKYIHSQMNPIHTLTPIRFNNSLLLSTPMSFTQLIPFSASDWNCIRFTYILHACYMSHQSHPPWLDEPNNIWWKVKNYETPHYKSFSTLLLLSPS
jgi:hypothetical protein